jgi:hypothetical protein
MRVRRGGRKAELDDLDSTLSSRGVIGACCRWPELASASLGRINPVTAKSQSRRFRSFEIGPPRFRTRTLHQLGTELPAFQVAINVSSVHVGELPPLGE